VAEPRRAKWARIIIRLFSVSTTAASFCSVSSFYNKFRSNQIKFSQKNVQICGKEIGHFAELAGFFSEIPWFFPPKVPVSFSGWEIPLSYLTGFDGKVDGI
jgi:hypothetical protein